VSSQLHEIIELKDVQGLVDSHAHPLRYGHSRQLQLQGSTCIGEVIRRVEAFVQNNASSLPDGAWIEGLGWDQNLWEVKEFPTAVGPATPTQSRS
jgi:predicted amidohydrolase YtcJ